MLTFLEGKVIAEATQVGRVLRLKFEDGSRAEVEASMKFKEHTAQLTVRPLKSPALTHGE